MYTIGVSVLSQFLVSSQSVLSLPGHLFLSSEAGNWTD